MDDGPLDKIIAEISEAVVKAIRKARETGYTEGKMDGEMEGTVTGVAHERARIARALASAGISLPTLPAASDKSKTKAGGRVYGAISNPVRDALRELTRAKPSVTAKEVHEYLRRTGYAVELAQIRSALKVMARPKPGFAKRLQRGQYAVGPNMPPPPASPDKAGGIAPTLSLN